MKYCTKCKSTKSLDAFGKDRHRSSGITSHCKECRNKHSRLYNKLNPNMKKKHNDARKSWRKEYYSTEENKLKLRNRHLKKFFNLTNEDYHKMLDKQNGVCSICKRYRVASNKNNMAVDHCHITGKIRRILCNWCNRGLGVFEDNIKYLENAIIYLTENQDANN